MLLGRSLGAHRGRDAVGAVDGDPALRDLVELVDEDGTLGLQAVHDRPVVDDLLADVDRTAELLERELDDPDRAFNAGAEAARLGEIDLHTRVRP